MSVAADTEPVGFREQTHRRGLKTGGGDRGRGRQGKCGVDTGWAGGCISVMSQGTQGLTQVKIHLG